MTDTSSPRVGILKEAVAVTSGDREDDYGSPVDNMTNIAAMWEAYLNANPRVWRPTVGGGWVVQLKGEDVAHMMALLKMARTFTGYKRDNYVDEACYPAIAGECRMVEEGEE